MSYQADNQLIVLKINQANGINDEIVIGLNDDSRVLAASFVTVSIFLFM